MYLESAHEVGCVGGFFGVGGSIVVDLIALVLGVGHELFELSDVFPGFSKVEGSEIFVEVIVDEVLG